MNNKGLTKPEQFRLIKSAGWNTPQWGELKDLSHLDLIVVYTDIQAHRGEGKELWQARLAEYKFPPNQLVSEFIPTTDDPFLRAILYRLLAVGNRLFRLKYESNSWQSGHAESIQVDAYEEIVGRKNYQIDLSHLAQWPLFAVDFVKHFSTELWYGIDFNTAPVLKDILSPKQVVEEIEAYLASQKQYGQKNLESYTPRATIDQAISSL